MKSKNSTHEIKELLKINHNWEDLKVGDSVTLLASAYGEADEFFSPGLSYKIIELKGNPEAPNENEIVIVAKNKHAYGLPYSQFNVKIKSAGSEG